VGRDFNRLWAARALSDMGSAVTVFALPLFAIRMLNATPLQMGSLTAAESLPAVLVSLFAGVWADRRPRRQMMIFSDLVRAGVLLVIPLFAAWSRLSIPLLIAVIFIVSSFTICFETASVAFLPTIVEKQKLVAANSRLTFSFALAEMSGPVIGGMLVQLLGSVYAFGLNVITFALSGVVLWSSRIVEARQVSPMPASNAHVEVWRGIHFVWRDRLLRSLTLRLAAWHFITASVQALGMLFAVRELGIGAALLGVLMSLGGLGALAGAGAAPALGRLLGPGPSIMLSIVVSALAGMLIPTAHGSTRTVGLVLGVCVFVFASGFIVYDISNVSLRQALTPPHLLGRVNATTRLLTLGCRAPAALLAGSVAELIGVRQTIAYASGLGCVLAVIGLFNQRLRAVRHLPDSLEGVL
jgi:MFS family permease